MSELRLIVGLGNPGRDYEETRHNLGFMIIQKLAEQYGLRFKRNFFQKNLIAQGICKDRKVILLLPQTYMNNSGIAVRSIIAKKGIFLENILVVCDDLNLDFGRLRLGADGSDGGHNGLGSLIQNLGSQNFARLRCGIGRPPHGIEASDYVLSRFYPEEKEKLRHFIQHSVDSCILWLKYDIAKAINEVAILRQS